MVAQAAEKPNLLFIITDEHNFRTLGCYRELMDKSQGEIWGAGNVVETPNLDRIAHNGVIFDRMYATTPCSTPARATMLTGYYGVQLGMPNNSVKPGDGKYLREDVPTIAQRLQEEGYKTGYSGKLHLAESRTKEEHEWWQPYPVGHPGYNYGFEDNEFMFNGGHCKFMGTPEGGKPYFVNKAKFVEEDENGISIFKDDKGNKCRSMTDFLGQCTVDFIEKNAKNPFYYVVSIPDPHTADIATGKYADMYKGMKFEKPLTYEAGMSNSGPKWQNADGKAGKIVEYNLAQYFGMVKNIDDCVGRMLDKLEEEGILENTIIVFTSDHGDLMGEHARMNKGTIHEASARVPFIMSYGMKSKKSIVPRGKVVSLAANTADWMPTFLSLMGVEPLKGMGRDLTPILSGSAPKDWKDIVFSTKGFVAAIDSRYKLFVDPQDDKPWLFDIEKDPNELINFIDDPAYSDVIKRLAPELIKFNKEVVGNDAKIAKKLKALQ